MSKEDHIAFMKERKEQMGKMKEFRDGFNKDMKKILNDEQYKKFEASCKAQEKKVNGNEKRKKKKKSIRSLFGYS